MQSVAHEKDNAGSTLCTTCIECIECIHVNDIQVKGMQKASENAHVYISE
jgi:hypothetical protein